MNIEDPHVGQRVRRIRHMSPLRPQRGTIRNVYGFDWANLTDEDVEVEWDDTGLAGECVADLEPA